MRGGRPKGVWPLTYVLWLGRRVRWGGQRTQWPRLISNYIIDAAHKKKERRRQGEKPSGVCLLLLERQQQFQTEPEGPALLHFTDIWVPGGTGRETRRAADDAEERTCVFREKASVMLSMISGVNIDPARGQRQIWTFFSPSTLDDFVLVCVSTRKSGHRSLASDRSFFCYFFFLKTFLNMVMVSYLCSCMENFY